mmetsp:Transcript_38563/g.114552  ORF Transcript_38563/g.114552 Transcript_38563/m.114552 type:complete len:285 (-) Transcript_38563:68-922(-)
MEHTERVRLVVVHSDNADVGARDVAAALLKRNVAGLCIGGHGCAAVVVGAAPTKEEPRRGRKLCQRHGHRRLRADAVSAVAVVVVLLLLLRTVVRVPRPDVRAVGSCILVAEAGGARAAAHARRVAARRVGGARHGPLGVAVVIEELWVHVVARCEAARQVGRRSGQRVQIVLRHPPHQRRQRARAVGARAGQRALHAAHGVDRAQRASHDVRKHERQRHGAAGLRASARATCARGCAAPLRRVLRLQAIGLTSCVDALPTVRFRSWRVYRPRRVHVCCLLRRG